MHRSLFSSRYVEKPAQLSFRGGRLGDRRGISHCLYFQSDRGRENRLSSAPPPSEPDRRVSRIRLSGRWFYLREDGQARARAADRESSPCSAKKAGGHWTLSQPRPQPFPPRRWRRILRKRLRTQRSRSAKIKGRLCLKYSNQPLRVRFRFVMMAGRLCPCVRRVWARIVSFNLSRLLRRGQRLPRSK